MQLNYYLKKMSKVKTKKELEQEIRELRLAIKEWEDTADYLGMQGHDYRKRIHNLEVDIRREKEQGELLKKYIIGQNVFVGVLLGVITVILFVIIYANV